MQPEGSLPCSQQPATDPVLSQMHPVHTFPPYFPKIHSNITSLQVVQPKYLISPLRATYTDYLIHLEWFILTGYLLVM